LIPPGLPTRAGRAAALRRQGAHRGPAGLLAAARLRLCPARRVGARGASSQSRPPAARHRSRGRTLAGQLPRPASAWS